MSMPVMNSKEQVILALFTAEVSEERILAALPPARAARIATLIAEDKAHRKAIRRDKSLTEYEEALGLDEGTRLDVLSISSRALIARTMIRAYDIMHPVLNAFRGRLFATLPSVRDQNALWDCASTLAGFPAGWREAPFWKGALDRLEHQLQLHALMRTSAFETADSMVLLTDEELHDYLYNRAGHCKECALAALSKVPAERLAPIWKTVQQIHRCQDEEEIEAQESKW